MNNETIPQTVLLPDLFDRPLVATFDQAHASSDGGAILLKADRISGRAGRRIQQHRDGPIGFSTDVAIDEGRDAKHIDVPARGTALDIHLTFDANDTVGSPVAITRPRAGPSMDFLQLGGVYHVSGQVADRKIEFTARGAAETFRRVTSEPQ